MAPKGTVADQEEREKKLTKAYSNATTALRKAHPDEFNQLRVKAAAELGIEWTPRPDEEQRARQQLQEIFGKYPHMRDEWSDDVETPTQ